MDSASNDLIDCHKCKNKLKNIDSKIVQRSNGLYRIAAKCVICKTNKIKFVKKPERKTKLDTIIICLRKTL